jgi:hypothetical protein
MAHEVALVVHLVSPGSTVAVYDTILAPPSSIGGSHEIDAPCTRGVPVTRSGTSGAPTARTGVRFAENASAS